MLQALIPWCGWWDPAAAWLVIRCRCHTQKSRMLQIGRTGRQAIAVVLPHAASAAGKGGHRDHFILVDLRAEFTVRQH